jgi:hypothetical protein
MDEKVIKQEAMDRFFKAIKEHERRIRKILIQFPIEENL